MNEETKIDVRVAKTCLSWYFWQRVRTNHGCWTVKTRWDCLVPMARRSSDRSVSLTKNSSCSQQERMEMSKLGEVKNEEINTVEDLK